MAGTAWSACASGLPCTAAGSRWAPGPLAASACARACRSSDRRAVAGSRAPTLAQPPSRRDDRREDASIRIGTMRSGPWLRRHALDALVIALAVVQQVEVWVADLPGPPLAVSLATALWTLPLLLRRRLPFAAPVFAFAVQIGASFIDPNAFGSEATGLVALLVTFWVVGAQDHASQAIAGAAIGCATLVVIAETDDRVDTGGAIFVMVMGAAVTLVAFTLRRRATRAAELEQRAQRLSAEHERHTRAAVAAERARIATDLRDVIAHSLSVMTVQAGAARLLLDTAPERACQPIVAVEDTGRQTLADLRRLLGLLHPSDDATRLPQPGM